MQTSDPPGSKIRAQWGIEQRLLNQQPNTLPTELFRSLWRAGFNSIDTLQRCFINNFTLDGIVLVSQFNILKINEIAPLVFSISFLHGLVNQSFVYIKKLYFTYSFKRLLFALIDCQYALFKISCSKTSYPTPCNVAHEWFVFLHRALLADWVDYIFPTSKCRYVVSLSIYSKIKSLKNCEQF